MTRNLIICIVLFLGAFSAFPENLPIYTNLTPANTTKKDFNDVCFRDSQNGFIVSKDGILFRTTNGGETWHVQERLQEGYLGGIHFKTLDTAFIVGTKSIFKSNDGGESWYETQQLPELDEAGNSYPAFINIHFISKNIGFMFGGRAIWKTADGGNSWKEVMLNYYFFTSTIETVHFTDSTHGIAFSHTRNFVTDDGGETWSTISTNSYLGNGYFNTDTHGYILETSGNSLLETSDGGNSWSIICADLQQTYDIIISDDLKNMKAFDRLNFSYSSDSGKTWQEILLPKKYTSYLNAMDFYDENHGFIVGDKGVILQTADGGLTWERKPWGFPQGFKRLFFQDSLNGTVISGDGIILHTTDGGAQWDVIDLGQLKEPDNITFPTRDTGYMTVNHRETNTDYYSYLYYTHDGGKNWEKSSGISTRNEVEGVDFLHFPTADTGYAGVNFWGETYATFDGGQTVKRFNKRKVDITDRDKLSTGAFPDVKHGFIFGPSGAFSFTKNSGTTWTRKDIPNKPTFGECHFYDSLTGLGIGRQYMYRTDDGGQTWSTVLENKNTTRYYEISESSGYVKIYSNDDSVYYTADKGKTWEIQHKGAIPWDEIYFVNPYLAYCTKQTTDSVGIYRVDFPRPEPQPFDTQRVVLQPGWNLFSTYISLNSASIEAFTKETSIDIIKNTHRFWHTGRKQSVNRLTEITAGEGYAIHCQSAEELVLVGYAMEPSAVHASKGWSLVGCSYAQPKGFEEIVSAISKAVSNNGYWKPNDNSSTIDSLEPGKAYYILVE